MDKVLVYISGLKITFQIVSAAKPAFFVAAISPAHYPGQLFKLVAQNSEPCDTVCNAKSHFSYWFSSRVKQVKGNGLSSKREEKDTRKKM